MKHKMSKINQNMLIMVIVGVVAVVGLAFLLLLVAGNDDRESVPANPNIETTKETKEKKTTTVVETEKGTSKIALELYSAKAKTINDPVAVAKLLETIDLTNKVAEYKVTLETKDDVQYMYIKLDKVVTEKDRGQFDDQLQKYAQQILALVEDADEVQWIYGVKANGKTTTVTVSLNAQTTTPLVKTDIKSFGASPKSVQKLLDLQKGVL